MEGQTMIQQGEAVLAQLLLALDMLKKHNQSIPQSQYIAYLHGQIYGLAMALKIMFPGPGGLGEKAALALRPVMTEHRCDCKE